MNIGSESELAWVYSCNLFKRTFPGCFNKQLNVRNGNISSSDFYISTEEKRALNLLISQFFVITFKLALLNFQSTYQMKIHSKKKSITQLIELNSKTFG